MTTILMTFLAVFIVSAVSLIGIFALALNQGFLKRILATLVGLAAGALIGDAVIHLIPEALEGLANTNTFAVAVLAGIIVFFALEGYLRWHHAHHGFEDEHAGHEIFETGAHDPTAHIAPLVIVADSLHNLIDGAIIAASFLVSVELGIATTIAVFLHEIPQEIADFGLLVHAGLTRTKALLFNFASGLSALVGAAIVLFISSAVENSVPFLVAFSAGSFLYIAIADVVPELHKAQETSRKLMHFSGLILGILAMFALTFFEAH